MKRRKDPGQNAEPELSQRSPDRPDPLAYPDVYPGMFPETEHPVSPEAPPGLDSDAVPIASDSPRRAPDPGRLGNPIKDKMEAQPENSDSPSDDSLMKPPEGQSDRPDRSPGSVAPGASEPRGRPPGTNRKR
jgi:hypothetical protein